MSNLKVTRETNGLIVTFTVADNETIDGRQGGTKPTWRSSVFFDTSDSWGRLAYTNLNPIQASNYPHLFLMSGRRKYHRDSATCAVIDRRGRFVVRESLCRSLQIGVLEAIANRRGVAIISVPAKF